MKLKVLDLFSGIGGFSLGLERAGFETVAFCEENVHATKILNKHWPDIPVHKDVRTLDARKYRGAVDVVCGGFPCQPHSFSGEREASEDSRDLWPEYFRIISEGKFKWVIGENVLGILSSENGRFFGRVLRGLASIGYDAEWFNLPGGAIGAEHIRPRIWLVAYPNKAQRKRGCISKRIQKEYTDTSYPRWGKDKPGVDRVSNGVPYQMDRLARIGNAVIPQIPEMIGKAIMECENETT